ncbi:hypothetical protein [Aeromicrobium massiliense]|uniref:hypothetical protein n=1 Tax=Aeromicrobium massiliense TaxID=1464554 RepID=UPI0002EE9F89|nr:hypothetical protein [Aeromicrobium massiliense]
MKKPLALALAAGITAAGAVLSSAATLGGLGGPDLGADTDTVASCDTDGVSVDYTTTYDTTAGQYVVSGLTLQGVAAACAGQDAEVTLAGASGTLGSGTRTALAGTNVTVPLSATAPATAIRAEDVTKIAVVISG